MFRFRERNFRACGKRSQFLKSDANMAVGETVRKVISCKYDLVLKTVIEKVNNMKNQMRSFSQWKWKLEKQQSRIVETEEHALSWLALSVGTWGNYSLIPQSSLRPCNASGTKKCLFPTHPENSLLF